MERKLPDTKEEMRLALVEVLKSGFSDYLTITHTHREMIKSDRRYVAYSVFFISAVLISLYIIRDTYGTWYFWLLIYTTFLWSMILLVTGRQWLSNNRLLAKEMNMALAPIMSNVIQRVMLYQQGQRDEETVSLKLREAKLITDLEKVVLVSDDGYLIYTGSEIWVRELSISPKNIPDEDKKNHKDTFRGLFVSGTFPVEVKGSIFISVAESKRSNFVHKAFWSELLSLGLAVEVEPNDMLYPKIHIAATEPEQVNKIFPSSFYKCLDEWYQEKPVNYRIAIHGDRFYMLIPEESIQVDDATTSAKIRIVAGYGYKILLPIWRAIYLLERVSDRES